MLIDQVSGFHLREVRHRLGNDSETSAGGMARCSDYDGRLADLLGAHQAILADIQDFVIVGLIENLIGDVLSPPVGEVGVDQKLATSLGVQDRLSRDNLQPFDPDRFLPVLRPVGSATLNPVEEGPIIGRILAEALPTAVLDGSRGLLQQQALFGLLQVDARGLGLVGFRRHHLIGAALHNPVIIVFGKEGIDGQLEAALTFDTSVTIAAVAALLGEDPADIPGETKGSVLLDPLDPHPDPCGMAGEAPDQVHFAVGQSQQRDAGL